MAIKRYKPITPGTRQKTVSDFSGLSGEKAHKPLLVSINNKAGRNNTGRITVRHHGGGNRVKYRLIDFKRNKDNIPGKVATIEYDPNRTAYIALINYADGEKRYILAPDGLNVGDVIVSGTDVDIKAGNCLPLSSIPVGTTVHNIEFTPKRGGQIARSAGITAQLMAKEGTYATLRMPSGEMRKVLAECRATIGQVSNLDHELVHLGKAGRKRHMGWRPEVRGVVMNPCDHPHGGGEGKCPVGMPSPVSPWGQKARGLKTRKHKNRSDKLMVSRIN